ncbi:MULTISPECIES: hypothetical protein [Limosilactobacillus]|uniref:hypothetical protein n=1 Tax=Limosilactobacillus TaxID=2742598 RepID=UPI0020730022|nr:MULTISPECIES: hypothetical protein [Limosilactobacillus]WCT60445.1 hypothetical protein PRK60_07710 [Limosilactobacillus portuensis]
MNLNIELRPLMESACQTALKELDRDNIKIDMTNPTTLINSTADSCTKELSKYINIELKRQLSEIIGRALKS